MMTADDCSILQFGPPMTSQVAMYYKLYSLSVAEISPHLHVNVHVYIYVHMYIYM